MFLIDVGINNSDVTYMYTGMEQLSKWMADSGNQDSHNWSGSSGKQREEAKIIYVVMNCGVGDIN